MESSTVWRPLVDGLCLAAVGIPMLVIKYTVSPTQRGFYCGDSSLYYPYLDSTVTTAVNVSVRQDSPQHGYLETETGPEGGRGSQKLKIIRVVS